MHFPALEAEALDGTPRRFPEILNDAPRNLVIVAFAADQRTQVESWIPFIDPLAAAGSIAVHMLIVLGRGMAMMKPMIVNMLRGGAPEGGARDAMALAFADLNAVSSALDIGDRGRIHLFVVSAQGEVQTHVTGPHTEEAQTSLSAALGLR